MDVTSGHVNFPDSIREAQFNFSFVWYNLQKMDILLLVTSHSTICVKVCHSPVAPVHPLIQNWSFVFPPGLLIGWRLFSQ